jgi:hypothetical protein
MSDIFDRHDGFYFWSEEDELIGPFEDYEQAKIAYNACLRWQAKDHKYSIRKMKIDEGL